MMKTFRDKVIIITGAGSGIGRAMAKRLAGLGASVVVTDRSGETAQRTAEDIQRAGGRAVAAALDVVDADAVQHLVEDMVHEYGRIDYLFNNAGIGIIAETIDHTLEDWHTTLDINLRGVIHGIHAAYPIMQRQGFGHIVNTASLAGLIPVPLEVAYVASKYAVVGLSTTLRAEAKAHGVKVSVVCPGFIDTSILFEHSNIKYADKMGLTSREDVKRILPVKAMDVDKAALVIAKGVSRNQAIIVITPHAKVLYILNRLSPGLFQQILKLHLRNWRSLYR